MTTQRTSEHSPGNGGAEAVAFDMLQDAGYVYQELTTLEATNQYVVRLRGVINGHHNGTSQQYVIRNGVRYELPLVWTIYRGQNTLRIWCSRRPVEHLFLQIGRELELDPDPELTRQATSIGPIGVVGTYMNTRNCWSGETTGGSSVAHMAGGTIEHFYEMARRYLREESDI